jgi:hypothetical protein
MDGGDKLFKHTVHHGPFLFGDGVRVCVYECQAKLRIFRVMAIPTTGDGSAFFSKFGRDV